jgi:hypothetical protein
VFVCSHFVADVDRTPQHAAMQPRSFSQRDWPGISVSIMTSATRHNSVVWHVAAGCGGGQAVPLVRRRRTRARARWLAVQIMYTHATVWCQRAACAWCSHVFHPDASACAYSVVLCLVAAAAGAVADSSAMAAAAVRASPRAARVRGTAR